MTDLRKAAEMALKQLQRDDVYLGHRSKTRADAIEALRQALAHEALDRMAAENQRLGLYDEDNLQTAIERGTKAWADVPNATEWVEELRGNDTREVTREVSVDAAYTKLDTTAGVLHKEWVGLTGKEIAECIQTGEGGFVKLLATYRAIEARLKEKNRG